MVPARGGSRGFSVYGGGGGVGVGVTDRGGRGGFWPVLAFALPPTARLIILSTAAMVFVLTLTACPLTAWMPVRPLRVRSDVMKTSAREGGFAGGELELTEALGSCGFEFAM